jgi:hypothetical protein
MICHHSHVLRPLRALLIDHVRFILNQESESQESFRGIIRFLIIVISVHHTVMIKVSGLGMIVGS